MHIFIYIYIVRKLILSEQIDKYLWWRTLIWCIFLSVTQSANQDDFSLERDEKTVKSPYIPTLKTFVVKLIWLSRIDVLRVSSDISKHMHVFIFFCAFFYLLYWLTMELLPNCYVLLLGFVWQLIICFWKQRGSCIWRVEN